MLQEMAEDRVAEAFPLQHELLGLPELAPGTKGAAAIQERRSKGGRPLGARNKRIEDVARAVVEHLGDPLVHLVAIATAGVDELVAIGLKPSEAFAEKRLAATAALPYLHQRQAVRVDVSSHQVVHLSITDGVALASQNQGVIDAIAVQLDSGELDSDGNPLNLQAFAPAAQLIADQAGEATATASAPLAPPAPPAPPTPPGGGGFAPAPLSRAPASVVSPSSRIFRGSTKPATQGWGDEA
jgi:hypothetical protein